MSVTPLSPRLNAVDAAAAQMSATPAALTASAAASHGVQPLSSSEQASVHHALYSVMPAATVEPTGPRDPTPASPTHPIAYATPAVPLFVPATSSRLTMSVRAASLPSPCWLSESTTLVALFNMDDSPQHVDTGVVGGAGTTQGGQQGRYTLTAQSELIRDSNSPVWRRQFVLPRSSNPRFRRARAHYMLRVYDVDTAGSNSAPTISEDAYLGLAVFDLEELIQNCRGGTGAAAGQEQQQSSGGFITVTLPLLHPTNVAMHESLVANNSTLTISLQMPPSDHAAAATHAQSSSSSSHSHPAPRSYSYTRLQNFLAPSIMANYMNLTPEISAATAAAADEQQAASSSSSTLLSVWYRPRSTATWTYLAGMDASNLSTLVLSDEVLTVESVALGGGGGDVDGDAAADAFEFRWGVFDKRGLVKEIGLGLEEEGEGAVDASARILQKAMEKFIKADDDDDDEDDENEKKQGGAASSLSASPSPFLGGASLTFKSLQAALDSPEGIQLALGASSSSSPSSPSSAAAAAARRLVLRVSTRPNLAPLRQTDLLDLHEAPAHSVVPPLAAPSLASSGIPRSVLQKTGQAVRAGVYFTMHSSSSSAAATAAARNVVVQLQEAGSEMGAARIVWRDAAPLPGVDAASGGGGSIDLAPLEHVWGGRQSEVLAAAFKGRSNPPSPDCLVSLSVRGTAAPVLDLEAATWAARDAFVFALLSAQQAAGMPVATWHPVPAEGPFAPQPPRIVPAEKPEVAAIVRAQQLGGPSGSLKPRAATSPKSPSAAPLSSAAASSSSPAAAAPASPTPATAASATSPVVLSDVLVKLEKLFTEGRNFVRFLSASARPFYIALWMARTPEFGPGGHFTLYWCRADHRNRSDTRSMRSDEIDAVVIGKQSLVFRRPEASLAPSTHCFSIVGSRGSLHLQAWNERDADTYAFGIASLLKQAGMRGVRLCQAGQYLESASRIVEVENPSERAESRDGTLAIDPHDIPALANAQGYKCTVDIQVKCRNLPSNHGGNHIVCAFERNEQTEQLTYLAQTEKQARPNPDFRKHFPLSFDSRADRKLRFNVYDLPAGSKAMDDEDRVGSCMIRLSEVVEQSGVEFVYRLSHENSTKQQILTKQQATIIVQCTNKSEMQLC